MPSLNDFMDELQRFEDGDFVIDTWPSVSVPDASYYFSFEDGFDSDGYDEAVEGNVMDAWESYVRSEVSEVIRILRDHLPPAILNAIEAAEDD